MPGKMTMDTSKVLRLPRKINRIFWKRRKSIAPATQNDFRHVTKYVWMSRSATPATRNEATRSLKPIKSTPSAELTIGTAIRPSRERLRTVADGCDCNRNVERTHPQPPDPQSETGTLATHSGKNSFKLLSSSDLHQLTFSIWHIFWHIFWHSMAFYQTFNLTFYYGILSAILSYIYWHTYILYILTFIGHSIWTFWHFIWYPIWHLF